MSNQHSNSNGSIRDIEREIDQDRSHLSATLSALENKFSPGQIVDQVLGYAKRNGGDFSDNLVKTVANNPLPTILTGIGVAWLAVSQGRSGSRSQYEESDFYATGYSTDASPSGQGFADGSSSSSKLSSTKGKASELKDHLSSSASHAGDKASHLASNARHSADAMRHRGQQQWARTSRGAQDFFAQNPLAVGAAAVAIGALIGASLPVSSREKEMLGETGERITDKAKSVAQEAKSTATEAGKAGLAAAKDKAKQSTDSKSTAEGAH